MKDNILYQDNRSAMLLAKNGRASSGKKTRHINVRYYFVKDSIASGEVSVEHCPTLSMLGDCFTKPLQGILFKRMRQWVMNWVDPELVDDVDPGALGNGGSAVLVQLATRSVLEPGLITPVDSTNSRGSNDSNESIPVPELIPVMDQSVSHTQSVSRTCHKSYADAVHISVAVK